MIDRRRFVLALGAGAVSGVAARALAQDSVHAELPVQSAATNAVMDQSASQPVRRPPKPNAQPSMTDDQRDALEHRIKCQCGCPLDIYTCRTTDFSCSVSPSMHRDVRSLVAGGYSADEIIDAFVGVYGEKVLMEPTRQGFNLTGYIAPFAALGVGAIVLGGLIRRWGIRAKAVAAASPRVVTPDIGASSDELERLAAAVRNEDDR